MYYVYFYIDPYTSLPFYVGKGRGGRAYHVKGHTHNLPVFNKLNKLLKENNDLTSVVILKHVGITEEEAFKLECSYIKQYGTVWNKSGTLLNLTEGGDNPPSQLGRKWKLSRDSKQKMRLSWTLERRNKWSAYQKTKVRNWGDKISESKRNKTPIDRNLIENYILSGYKLKDIMKKENLSLDIIRDRFMLWYKTPRFRDVRSTLLYPQALQA